MQEAPAPNLLDMVFGFAPAQIIHVAARLGIADQLADGALTSTNLAAATETHPPSMYRLLRASACFGVVTEVEPNRFELTPAGASLRSAAPDSIRHW